MVLVRWYGDRSKAKATSHWEQINQNAAGIDLGGGGLYTDPGMDYYEHKYQEQILNNLKKKAQSLGFELVPQTLTTVCVS